MSKQDRIDALRKELDALEAELNEPEFSEFIVIKVTSKDRVLLREVVGRARNEAHSKLYPGFTREELRYSSAVFFDHNRVSSFGKSEFDAIDAVFTQSLNRSKRESRG